MRPGVMVVAAALLLQLLAISFHHHSPAPARSFPAVAAAMPQGAAAEQASQSEDRSSPSEEGRAHCQVCWLGQLAASIDLPADATLAAVVIYRSAVPITPEPPEQLARTVSILKARGPPHA